MGPLLKAAGPDVIAIEFGRWLLPFCAKTRVAHMSGQADCLPMKMGSLCGAPILLITGGLTASSRRDPINWRFYIGTKSSSRTGVRKASSILRGLGTCQPKARCFGL